MEPSPLHSSILPLNCSCNLAAAKPSSRTATGRRCRLLYYVDLGNGYHFSQSIHCTLQIQTSTPASVPGLTSPILHSITSAALALLPATLAHFSLQHPTQRNMCRHHHMRCRHGGSGGSAICPSSLPPSTSSSPSASPPPSPSSSHFHGRYPNTRSGRGQARPCEVHQTDGATQSTNPTTTTEYAQFRFRCSMDRPVVIATILVDFREQAGSCIVPAYSPAKNQVPPPHDNVQRELISSHLQKAKDYPSISGSKTLGGNATSKAKGIQVDDREPQDTTGGKQAGDTDSEDYGCLIVEEKPSS